MPATALTRSPAELPGHLFTWALGWGGLSPSPPQGQGPRPPDRHMKRAVVFPERESTLHLSKLKEKISSAGGERGPPPSEAVVPELRGSETAISGKGFGISRMKPRRDRCG